MMKRILACTFGLGLAASAHAQGATPQELADQAHALIKTYCTKCHNEGASARMPLKNILDFKALVDDGVVIAGKPEDSLLYKRLTSTEKPMPPGNAAKPTRDEIAVIRGWIASGALAAHVN